MEINVWTDGSCLGNHLKTGARAGVGVWFGHNDLRNVSEPLQGLPQTNNRAELMGVIRAIEQFSKTSTTKQTLIVHTDSQYCKNGILHWITNWKKNGWMNSRKKPVKNKDLWLWLDQLQTNYSVQFKWVKAHSGIEGNEHADKLAVQGSRIQ